jgi:hypothetical protein
MCLSDSEKALSPSLTCEITQRMFVGFTDILGQLIDFSSSRVKQKHSEEQIFDHAVAEA